MIYKSTNIPVGAPPFVVEVVLLHSHFIGLCICIHAYSAYDMGAYPTQLQGAATIYVGLYIHLTINMSTLNPAKYSKRRHLVRIYIYIHTHICGLVGLYSYSP